tara:strand:+ start:2251 stop:2520 length:270 start_codon:yes stop_codon:yes gene_type:complete
MDFLGLGLGLGGSGIALFVLKKIPNDKICAFVEGGFEKLGILMTAGLTKFWLTKALWNKTIEPYFIDLIDNVAGGALRGLVKGLRSDNK